MQVRIEHLRIPLTGAVAIIFLFIYCHTCSHWETGSKIISYLLFLFGIFLVAIASLGRMWCSLYIAGYKDEKLIMYGPYSLCRNPLYFFSMLGAVGVGLATETITFPIILLLLFSIYYPFVIKAEERRLSHTFGISFEEYKSKTRSFFPSLVHFEEPTQYSVNPKVYRRHIFSALWFIWIIGILEAIEGLKEIGILDCWWQLY